MTQKPSDRNPISKLPVQWLVIIVFALVAYGLGQPWLNRKLGWQLPSLAALLGSEDKQKAGDDAHSKNTGKSGNSKRTREPTSKNASDVAAEQEPAIVANIDSQITSDPVKAEIERNSKSSDTSTQNSPNATNKSSSTSKPASIAGDTKKSSSPTDSLHYGLLRDTGRENFVSPAGLRYTRGSEEGHRLKHIERHLQDIPDRVGSHGVFDGDMPQVLKWLDEAYTRIKSGGKGIIQEPDEEGRIAYELSFPRPIGYIGGRDGARRNHPQTKRLRLVLAEEDRVITAFPF